MAIQYVSNADGKGWLTVRHASDSTYPPLPQLLKVDVTGRSGGRDQFRILDGRLNGQDASVSAKSDGGSYLGSGSHTAAARVRYEVSSGKLWYGGRGPVDATTMAGNPPPAGRHDLEIPYEVHALARHYSSSSAFATTWFRIGHSGDRFLHPGRISAGCATVTDLSRWTSIYTYLISARKDVRSVGTIEVV